MSLNSSAMRRCLAAADMGRPRGAGFPCGVASTLSAAVAAVFGLGMALSFTARP